MDNNFEEIYNVEFKGNNKLRFRKVWSNNRQPTMLWYWRCHRYNLKGEDMCGQSLSNLVYFLHGMECKSRAHHQRLVHKKGSCTKHYPCFGKRSTWMDWGYLCFEMRIWSCLRLTGIEHSNLKLKKSVREENLYF